jgi:hypothetical protein
LKPSRDWIGASAGFLFILLAVVGIGIGADHPSSIGPIEDIKSRFLTDPGPFAIQASSYIQALSMLPFVVFGVRIAQRLWFGGQQWLAAVALSGAILTAGIGLVENSLLSVLAYSVASDGDPGAIKALYGLRHILIVYVYVPEALTAFAFAIAFGSLAGAVFARWYGWLTALVGLLLLSGAADLGRTGFFGVQGDHWFYVLLIYSLWTLLTSGMLLTRQRTVLSARQAAS